MLFTGSEAMYADLGHFSPAAIRVSYIQSHVLSPHIHAAHTELLMHCCFLAFIKRVLFAVELLDALANTHSHLLGTGCLADCVS